MNRLLLLALVCLSGCGSPRPQQMRLAAAFAVPGPGAFILDIRFAPNDTNAFHCYSLNSGASTTWHASSNACPLRVDLLITGPAGSNCVIEYQPELGMPRVIIENGFVVGANWCEVSPSITLTGVPQSFSTGAFEPSSFYRIRIKP